MHDFLKHFCSILLFILLCGCEPESLHQTQVIAKVDGTDITASQLNHELTLVNQTNPSSKPAKIQMEILNQLIDHQLLANEALKQNLNRTPEVVQAVEAAKMKLYAQAYIDKLAAKSPAISQKELASFKAEHPEIFLNHQNYVLEKIAITESIPLLTVEEIIFKGIDFVKLKQLLNEANITISPVLVELPAEEMLPLFLEKHKQALKVGDFVVITTESLPQIMGIVAIKNMPLDAKQSDLLASRLLKSQKAEELKSNEINRLKQFSNIQAIGNFGN